MALFLNVLPGESLTIGRTRITLEDKAGRRARLRIESPDDVHHEKAGSPALSAPKSAPAARDIPTLRPPKPAG